jgi:signal transduction histidine kinase
MGINMMVDQIRFNQNLSKENIKINLLNEELVKINGEKDKFFSIIAHDLMNPFNSILGFSEILCDEVTKKNYQGIIEYSDFIHKSSKQAMDLLLNLMEWSRSQTGRMKYMPEYFEIGILVNDVILLLSGAAWQKSIRIKKVLIPDTMVYADKNMLNTVLRNLISNAVKFTHLNGEIIISIENRKTEIVVSVSDNGVGIAQDKIENIFRIDANSSTPGTQNEKGTGLGLILCKEFVEKNGGKIWIESKVGIGSTFYFSLPMRIEHLVN